MEQRIIRVYPKSKPSKCFLWQHLCGVYVVLLFSLLRNKHTCTCNGLFEILVVATERKNNIKAKLSTILFQMMLHVLIQWNVKGYVITQWAVLI